MDVWVILKIGLQLNNGNEHMGAVGPSMNEVTFTMGTSLELHATPKTYWEMSPSPLDSQRVPCPNIQHQDCILSRTHPACFYTFTFRFLQPCIALSPKVFSGLGLSETMLPQRFLLWPLTCTCPTQPLLIKCLVSITLFTTWN